jgi:hypothetical protein
MAFALISGSTASVALLGSLDNIGDASSAFAIL